MKTNAEYVELIRRMRDESLPEPERLAARDELVQSFKGLAYSIADRYTRNMPREDARQESLIGLLAGLERYKDATSLRTRKQFYVSTSVTWYVKLQLRDAAGVDLIGISGRLASEWAAKGKAIPQVVSGSQLGSEREDSRRDGMFIMDQYVPPAMPPELPEFTREEWLRKTRRLGDREREALEAAFGMFGRPEMDFKAYGKLIGRSNTTVRRYVLEGIEILKDEMGLPATRCSRCNRVGFLKGGRCKRCVNAFDWAKWSPTCA